MLMQGDCLEKMKEIESGSVDAIITDPPYGTMTGISQEAYKSPSDFSWDEVIDHKSMLEECNRILRPNGALVLFSQDPYTAKLITETHGNLPFSYRYTWKKDSFGNVLMCNKAPVKYTEDVCVFFKKHTKHDFEGFHPLRPYAKKVLNFIGLGLKQINEKMGHRRAEHFFYIDSTQFGLCTENTYDEMQYYFGIYEMDGFRHYDEIKAIDKAYREDMIRQMTDAFPKTFNLPEGKKYKSNVLEYRKDYRGEHPTQKPVALMEDLVKTYTNEGETVLDFTMGSGTCGVAAANLSRNFIGIERDEGYFNIAEKRVAEALI